MPGTNQKRNGTQANVTKIGISVKRDGVKKNTSLKRSGLGRYLLKKHTNTNYIVKGWKFLIRVKNGTSGAVTNCLSLLDTDEINVPVSLVLGRSYTKEALSIKNHKPIGSNTIFDFLPLLRKSPHIKLKITFPSVVPLLDQIDQFLVIRPGDMLSASTIN